jgi:hypothetical protein
MSDPTPVVACAACLSQPNRLGLCASCTLRTFRKPSRYPWTADMDDQLRQAYSRSTTRNQLSGEINRLCTSWRRPRYIIANRAQSLGLSLLPWKPWTSTELTTLRELSGQQSVRGIAKRLHRSPDSVKHQIALMGLSGEVAEGYSIHQLQRLLGVNHARIQGWLSKQWLSSKDDRITERSLKQFLVRRMDAYSFRKCDEPWLKGMLHADFWSRDHKAENQSDRRKK